MKIESVICDACQKPIGMGSGIEMVSADLVVVNHKPYAKEPTLRTHVDFCNRACAKQWMAANL